MTLRAATTEEFLDAGYAVERGLLYDEVADLDRACTELSQRARDILASVEGEGISLADYYRRNEHELIVVPEASDPREVCRYEYMVRHSRLMAERVVPAVQRAIEELIGEPFVLFKDKCNLKSPGGGAFAPHQDATAYQHFGPQFHVTAAVAIDHSTAANGCVQMASDYRHAESSARAFAEFARGRFPLFPHHDGGAANGNIQDAISAQFRWQDVLARPGDVLLFDSFVPHRSGANRSGGARRMLFLTFNPAADGDWYEEYYREKRRDYDHPRFHVSTPTNHRAREGTR